MLNEKDIIIGVDGGATAGAATAIDMEGNIIGFEFWYGKDSRAGIVQCSLAADRMKNHLDFHWPVRDVLLAFEGSFIFVRPKKFDDLRAAKEFAKTGYVQINGTSNRIPMTVGWTIGIWLKEWPHNYVEYPPTEWRKILGISKKKSDTNSKQGTIRWALEQDDLPESFKLIISGGNDHVADSFGVARAALAVQRAFRCGLPFRP